jgi:hypothetical protein
VAVVKPTAGKFFFNNYFFKNQRKNIKNKKKKKTLKLPTVYNIAPKCLKSNKVALKLPKCDEKATYIFIFI